MDSITQAALGAAIGEATLGKNIGKKGMLVGAAIATIPDLDVLLYLLYDKFEMLNIHRGFSHSIIFSIVGSLLLSLMLSRFRFIKNIPFYRLWLFNWLALFTHIILDAFTAYGTQLFLPFSDCRFGWDSINVVDPVYTATLILGLSGVIFFKKKQYNTLGLIVSTIYLLSTLGIKGIVNERLRNDLAVEKIDYTQYSTMPVGSASLNWYGIARNEEHLYLKKYSLFQKTSNDFNVFKINEDYFDNLSPKQRERMTWFAKGFYTVEKNKDSILVYNLQVDMRGIVNNDSVYAPTKGYFKFIPKIDGGYEFGSGSHE
jgi:inner membrane protein